ncbi:MAG: peptidoglycan bridge formation glycyltransferase FemA/FemB family protein, partial [Patescibacteria group bacterium]|nr:peptidoglycan bridge formation glycyltransferase FemA/FemB family protein [Patescibacteria group bacterium]
FYTHNIDYYQKILRIFGPSDMARLYGVKFNNKYLAMALVTFFGKEAVYYYGASDNENRELMAPWLLQWEMIKEAKNRGCTRYDFLGIAPEPYKKVGNSFGIWLGAKEVIFQNEKTALDYCEHKHPFSSITFFKTRWGGTRKNYVGAWEKVYNHRKYRVLLWTKLIRKYIRKLGIKI